jgi:hypothetical protein
LLPGFKGVLLEARVGCFIESVGWTSDARIVDIWQKGADLCHEKYAFWTRLY